MPTPDCQCTAGDTAAGLRTIHASAPWTHRAWYDPRVRDRPAGEHERACARDALVERLCNLPVGRADSLPRTPIFAFGDQPLTIGKFLAQWSMHLWLGVAASPPYRYVLPQELRAWVWLPEGHCDADGAPAARDAWFAPDVCSGRRGTDAAALVGVVDASATGRKMLAHLRGNSSGTWGGGADSAWMATDGGGSTHAGLWVAGAMMRLTLDSLGPCADATARSLLATQPERRRLGRCAGPTIAAPTIAVHIRRGDACERWAPPARRAVVGEGRPCYHTRHYAQAVRAIVDTWHGGGEPPRSARVLVASDSPTAVAEMRRELAAARGDAGPHVSVGAVRMPRGAGWGGAREGSVLGAGESAARLEFIEKRYERGLVNRTAALGGALADLLLLRTANGFVGTASSWFSRLVLLAIVGERAAVPPFAMIDQPLRRVWFV